MESLNQYEAAHFRVALLLKQYKFGAASAAKYLGKTRGLVQSWMQIGNKHFLAKEDIKLRSFEKIVKKLRRRITKEHMEYFLVKRLLELELPTAFISKVMELPTSTVRSWRYGKVPNEIKKFFYEQKMVDREFNKLIKFLKSEVTRKNLEYFLALKFAKPARSDQSRRRIGGRLISQILTNYYNRVESIPEKTVSCWIDGKRKPWDAFDVLVDEVIIRREFTKIVDWLTYQHLNYHLSKALAEQHEWKYGKIAKELELKKELVRGWVKKRRGSPVAKTFVNEKIVENEVNRYVNVNDISNQTPNSLMNRSHGKRFVNMEKPKAPNEKEKQKKQKRQIGLPLTQLVTDDKEKPSYKNKETGIQSISHTEKSAHENDIEFDHELEQELIYHLETIPTGVTSANILKSILIDHRDTPVEEIEKILQSSKRIIQHNGKWMLKKYVEKSVDKPTIDEDLMNINYSKGQDHEIIY